MYLRVDDAKIDMADEMLDLVKARLREACETGIGFWLCGGLVSEGSERTVAGPEFGHQCVWVHPSRSIRLVYDAPGVPGAGDTAAGGFWFSR